MSEKKEKVADDEKIEMVDGKKEKSDDTSVKIEKELAGGHSRTRSRGLSQKVASAARRLSLKKKPMAKHFEPWDKSHPYSYTIGDIVEESGCFDLKTGKTDMKLFFAHPDVSHKKKDKRKIRKVFVSFKIKRVSEIDNVEEKFRIKFHMCVYLSK